MFSIFQTMARPFVVFVERFYPNPLVFVIALTGLTFVLAFALTDISAAGAIEAWGSGLPKLLAFMAQISITLIAAHTLAHTDAAQRFLRYLAGLPKTTFTAYFTVVFVAGVSSLVAWSLGLVAGALMARQVAIEADRRGLALHYPLLVASAYAGFVLWHMGYSGSSALFVATPGHILEAEMGILPVSETIFAPFNLIIAVVALTAICLVCPLMHPSRSEEIIRVEAAVLAKADLDVEEMGRASGYSSTLGKQLDRSRWFTLALGGLLTVFVVRWFWQRGLDLNLNIVNWTFLAAGLLLTRHVDHYVGLVKNASRTVGEILLQYPFYAGILGLMTGSGLVELLSGWFVANASAGNLSFFAFLSGGLVNLFIPSGGGQWVVQGPIFVRAAQALGVDPAVIVMGISYGDQWTNMVQPFFTIPLLAIAGLDMRKIMGYTFVILLVTFVIFGGSLLLMGAG